MLFFYDDDELKLSLPEHSYARKAMKASRILPVLPQKSFSFKTLPAKSFSNFLRTPPCAISCCCFDLESAHH